MWEDSGFGSGLHGTDPLFDSNNDGHLNAFESDHAECFLHDCDTFDQVLAKEGSLSSGRSYLSAKNQRASVSASVNKHYTENQSSSMPPPSNDGGYNIHSEFNDKYPQAPKSNHNVVKFMLVSIVVVVAIAIISNAVDSYSEHQAKAAEDARQEFAAEVENMDLSPYCKKYIKDLSVTKTDFNGTGGSSYDNDLYHSNSITIDGTAVGTERLSHQQVYNYMFATLNVLYDDIESMCAESIYVHHLNRGHALNHGDRVYHYRNYISFYLRDSNNEYSVSLFYPPAQASNKSYFVKAISSENKGEEWSYRITDKNGDYIFEASNHLESDAVRAERNRQYKSRYGSSSKSNSSTSSSSSSKRRSSGTYKKKDTYNSSRYKDADSFAEDYYEDFYDYDDYEDDDDAYDAAVDYWNDWND